MACVYYIKGREVDEIEFKKLLNEGLLDQLITRYSLEVEGFIVNEQLAGTTETIFGAEYIQNKVVRKINTRANFEYVGEQITKDNRGNITNKWVDNNPIKVLKDTPFIIGITNRDGIIQGLTREQQKQIKVNAAVSMKPGIPYMFVPSAYGLYPIQLKARKIKDLSSPQKQKVNSLLKSVFESKNQKDAEQAIKELNSFLYRIDFHVDEKGKIRTLKKSINEFGEEVSEPMFFNELEKLYEYINNQISFVDWTKINKNDYNEKIANEGRITTNLFNENGNFFNSSSFVIAAHGSSIQEGALKGVPNYEIFKPFLYETRVAEENIKKENTAPSNQNTKVDESSSYDVPVDDLTPLENLIPQDITPILTSPEEVIKNRLSEEEKSIMKEYEFETTLEFENTNIKRKAKVSAKATSRGYSIDTMFIQDAKSKKYREANSKEKRKITNSYYKQETINKLKDKVNAFIKLTKPTAKSFEEGEKIEVEIPVIEESTALEDIISSLPDIDIDESDIDTEGLDNASDESGPTTKFRTTSKENLGTPYTEETRTKEIKYVSNRISNFLVEGSRLKRFENLEELEAYLPKELFEQLLEARKNGRMIHGLFTRAAMYLNDNAFEGTAYHEAFHVVFNLGLTYNQRLDILKDARITFRKELEEKFGDQALTWLNIEEFLADKYMEYVQAAEALPESTLGTKVKKYFKGLYRGGKLFFNKDREINIDGLFEDIDLAVYKNRVKFDNTDVSEFKLRSTTYEAFENVLEGREASDYFINLLEKFVENRFYNPQQSLNIEDRNPDFGDGSMQSIITALGKKQLIEEVTKQIHATLSEAIKNKQIAHVKRLNNLLKAITGFNNEFVTIENKKYVYKSDSPFINSVKAAMARHGLKLSNNSNKINTVKLEDVDEVNVEKDSENEDFAESWQKSHMEYNPFDSASRDLKFKLSRIKIKNVKTGDFNKNSYGSFEYYDPRYIYNYLSFYITDAKNDSDSMMQKLLDIEEPAPFVQTIKDMLESDPSFKGELFDGLGNLTRDDFFTFYINEKGQRSLFLSNRKNVDTLIQENILSQVLYNGNELFNDYPKGHVKEGQSDYSNINQNKVKQLRKKIDNINSKDSTYIQSNLSEFFEELSNLFLDFNIKITPNHLKIALDPARAGVSKKASWNNIKLIVNSLEDIIQKLEAGNNPFTDLVPDKVLLKASKSVGKSSVENIARAIKPAMEEEVVNVFRNAEGKNVYAVHLSNHLKRLISTFKNKQELTNYLTKISGDPILSRLPFIKSLYTEKDGIITLSEFSDNLHTAIFDALSQFGKYKKVDYKTLNSSEKFDLQLTAFQSETLKGGTTTGYFLIPNPADATNIPLMKMEKFSNKEVISQIVEIAKGEAERIQLATSLTKEDPLYHHPYFRERGSSFVDLAFLNSNTALLKAVRENHSNYELLLEQAINKYFKEIYLKEQFEYYIETGVLKVTDESKIILSNISLPKYSERLKKRLEIKSNSTEEIVGNFLMNQYLATLQMNLIFNKSQAFYKSAEDYSKRAKQVVSPGQYNSSDAPVNALIVEDETNLTEKTHMDHIFSLVDSSLEKGEIGELKAKEIKARWTAHIMDEKEAHNNSDGATFVSVDFYIDQLEQARKLTPAHLEAAERIRRGEESLEDLALFLQKKPYLATEVTVAGGGYNIVMPVQIKTAQFVLTKTFAHRKDKDGNFIYPKLVEAHRVLTEGITNSKGENIKIDMIPFISAAKVGAIGQSVDKDGKVKFADFQEQADKSFKILNEDNILTFKESEWREQQKVPSHYVDEEAFGNFGSQIRHLLIADPPADLKSVIREYQDLIALNLKESYEEAKALFYDETGENLDYESISKLIKDEVEARDLGEAYKEAVELVTKTIIDEKTGEEKEIKTPALPYWHPSVSYKIFSILNGVFKNRVTKQKIYGGAMINTPSFGVSHTLKWEVNPDTGAVTMQALLPWNTRKYFPTITDEESPLYGQVDLEQIPDELKRIIGYRIPTEHKYSIFNIEIVGFTDPAQGPSIILPTEATTQAGLDFDIDKLYMMLPSFYVKGEKGKERAYYLKPFTENTTPKEIIEVLSRNPKALVDFIKKYNLKTKESNFIINTILDSFTTRRELSKELGIKKAEREELQRKANEIKLKNKYAKSKSEKKLSEDEALQFIQDNINDLNESIEESNSFLLQMAKKVFELADIKKTDYVQLNNKLQRDNRLLEIAIEIMNHPKSGMAVLDYGNFDNLKILGYRTSLLKIPSYKNSKKTESGILKLNEELQKLDSEFEKTQDSISYRKGLEELYKIFILDNLDLNSPSAQDTVYRRNMAGVALTGVFANHSIHHAKSQYVNFNINEEYGIKFNGKIYTEFNKEFSVEITPGSKVHISQSLASLVAGILDNAKEPISDRLNLNRFTADIIATMIRAGIDEKTAFTFINTKAIISLTNEYFKNPSRLKIKEILKESIKDLRSSLDLQKLQKIDLNLNLEELEKAVTDSQNVRDLKILESFQNILNISEELSTIVQASRVDTVPVGPSAGDNFITILKQKKILSKANPIFNNAKEFLKGSQIINSAFQEYAIEKPISILEEIFSYVGEYEKDNFKFSLLGKLKMYLNDIANHPDSGFTIDSSDANVIDKNFMTFLISDLPFFSREQSFEILSNIPARVNEFQKKYPDSLFNKFLQQIHPKAPTKNNPLSRLEFYTTGKQASEIQGLRDIWEAALSIPETATDPGEKEAKQLALDLVKYTFFSAGFNFSPYSFFHLIPTYFWTSEFVKDNPSIGLKADGKTLTELIENRNNDLKKDQFEGEIMVRFLNQFLKNHSDKYSPFYKIPKKAEKSYIPTVFTDKSEALQNRIENNNLKPNEVIITRKDLNIHKTEKEFAKSLVELIKVINSQKDKVFLLTTKFLNGTAEAKDNKLLKYKNIAKVLEAFKDSLPANLILTEKLDPRRDKIQASYNIKEGILKLNYASYLESNAALRRFNSQKGHEFLPPYIRVGENTLMKKISTDNLTDGKLVENQIVIYKKTEALGTKNFVLEYSYNSDIVEGDSIIPKLLEEERTSETQEASPFGDIINDNISSELENVPEDLATYIPEDDDIFKQFEEYPDIDLPEDDFANLPDIDLEPTTQPRAGAKKEISYSEYKALVNKFNKAHGGTNVYHEMWSESKFNKEKTDFESFKRQIEILRKC